MISDDDAKRLHDKATRGMSLFEKEQSQLENWYAIQDSIENNNLTQKFSAKKSLSLQKQIETILSQLMTVTKRIIFKSSVPQI
ncbi:hypothetical protein H8E88_31650 [candidate division KSB1 bacterium]|nr:hypothetical protein [candidate division KSB1 bacterium]